MKPHLQEAFAKENREHYLRHKKRINAANNEYYARNKEKILAKRRLTAALRKASAATEARDPPSPHLQREALACTQSRET
jgi:hypothetical protein